MGLRQEWTCDRSDLMLHGSDVLGYDWNTICKWIYEENIGGEDGAGSDYLYHSKMGEDIIQNPDMQAIIDSLLDTVGIEMCKVIDD